MDWLLKGVLFATGVAAFALILSAAAFLTDGWLRSFTGDKKLIKLLLGFAAIFAALLVFSIFGE